MLSDRVDIRFINLLWSNPIGPILVVMVQGVMLQ